MKIVLKPYISKRTIAVMIAFILLLSSLHIGIVTIAEDHKTVVYTDSTKGVGWFNTDYQVITTNVAGVSDDNVCTSVKVVTPQEAPQYNTFATNKEDISALGLSPAEVNTIWLWLYNPRGNGDILFRYNQYGSDYKSVDLSTPNTYLVDINKGTSTLATFQYDVWAEIPDGFKGYVVYDMTASENKELLNSYAYKNMQIWYRATSTIKNKLWYYDNITYSTKKADAVIDEYLSYVPQPISSYSGSTVLENQEIKLTADGENIEIYYTLDGSEPDNTSAKYTDENPLVITNDVTVKAVAYRGEYHSEVLTLDYKIYDESQHKNKVLSDGSVKGYVYDSGKQSVTTGVSGVSADNVCFEVKLKAAVGSSHLWVKTNSAAIANVGLSVDEIKSTHFWLRNPKGNGPIQVGLACHPSSYYDFLPGTFYLVNAFDGTYTKYNSSDKYVTVPDGFEGYIIYDVQTSAKYSKLKEYNFGTLSMWYKLPNMVAGDVWYFDNITASTEDAEFIAYRLTDGMIAAPKTDSFTTYVKVGEKVNLTAPEGDIYYTLDGTTPTTSSTKFDAANPIIIDKTLTIKAIAVIDGAQSLVAEFDYETIDPNAPNNTTVNDGSNPDLFVTTAKADVSVVEDVSPLGKAYNSFGNASSGTGVHTFKFEEINSGLILAKDAFSMWIKVPQNEVFTFKPAFNTSGDTFEGNIATYDTETGEIKAYSETSEITLEGFEGYVMLLLDDTAKIGNIKWYEYVVQNGLVSFILETQNKENRNADIAFDTFGFVTDYKKYQIELNPSANRPDSPYAAYDTGIMIEGTTVMLYGGSGTDIYYTLDGTAPTTESTRFVLQGMGAFGDISPIEINEDTVIKAIAVKDGICSGVATYKYTVQVKYSGPNAVIANDGSGEGNNVVSGYNTSLFKPAVVEDVSPYGSAFKFERIAESENAQSLGFSLKCNPNLEAPDQIKAFSVYVKIPKCENDSIIRFRINGDSNTTNGDVYTIGVDGKVKAYDNYATVNGFEGIVLLILDEKESISVNYSSYVTDWGSFAREFGLKSLNCYITRFRPDCDEIVVDELTAYYDIEQTMLDFDIEGLLADYGISTYENLNMMVSNDCSGAKVNSGLTAFSDNLTIEKSTVSNDDRNIAVKFGKGKSFIEFNNCCKDGTSVIGDGIAFWVMLPNGSGKTTVDFGLDEAYTEKFVYNEKYHHYRIDADGVITRADGAIELPDGFRGWVVIPKNSMIFDEENSVGIINAWINFESVSTSTITFLNENNELDGKTVLIDDISWYTDFTKLVQSQAYRWEGQVFEN